jgi:SAM-dependent methyltransferase
MRSEVDMLAYSLETEEELLPLLPELLADIWALGSDVETIVGAVKALSLPPTSRVIDLGCGKGAVSIALAKALNFRVLGIDLFEPFVRQCEEYARQNGVEDLCEFRHGNIVNLAGQIEPADVAIFAALGDVLGTRTETMSILRRYVRPGGFVVINDDFLRRADGPSFPGFEGAAVRDVALSGWAGQGDVLVYESIETDDDDENGDNEAELIARRADALARANPSLAAAIDRFALSQAEEYDLLAKEFVSATWVFRRG